MKKLFSCTLMALVGAVASLQSYDSIAIGPGRNAGAGRGFTQGDAVYWASRSTWGDYWARNQAMQKPWHGDFYYLPTGQPTALIVSPTITMQQNYSWGVSQNTMTPVYHQFGQGPASGGGGGQFKATPHWPSHTDQFGIYPVRGPW